MCGIVGVLSTDLVNQQIYDSLLLLQHRGQDSTGIATMDGSVFHMRKSKGQVNEGFRTRDMRSLKGNIGLGHVRYATKGAADSEEEIQPFYVNAPYGIILVHNGNLTNTRELENDLYKIDRRHTNSTSDTEMLLNVLATELQDQISGKELFKYKEENVVKPPNTPTKKNNRKFGAIGIFSMESPLRRPINKHPNKFATITPYGNCVAGKLC